MKRFKPYRLDATTVRRAKRMLAAGASNVGVQGALGIGKGSVCRITNGSLATSDDGHTRCQGCGGLQLMPCRVCSSRAQSQAA